MISIVIPTLNEEAYIAKTLESLLNQEKVLEIILVDAHSDDGTVRIAQSIADKMHLPLRVITSPVRDVGKQRNLAAAQCRGEWILFLDADVLLPAEFTSKALTELEKRKLKLAGTPFFASEPATFYRIVYWLYARVLFPIIRIFIPVLHGCSLFVQMDLHKRTGGFREGVTFEDYDYSRRAAQIAKSGVLRDVYVRTSARRFYNASAADNWELIRGTAISLLQNRAVAKEDLARYQKKTGKHGSPRF